MRPGINEGQHMTPFIATFITVTSSIILMYFFYAWLGCMRVNRHAKKKGVISTAYVSMWLVIAAILALAWLVSSYYHPFFREIQ